MTARADAHDSKSCTFGCAGSTPASGTPSFRHSVATIRQRQSEIDDMSVRNICIILMVYMSQQYPPLLVIIGPTASGKSDLAVDLALRYGGEVISADSRQVYQSLFYTTGKISEEEMRGVPHHMLDVVPQGESYNAHLFVDAASRHIADIYTRGSIPIVAGRYRFLY